ncbi:MAG: hypothetical protein DRI44_09230 [Chlamydiae bacterium]|nr:MAG: hypothetical protein DRI44_09230 [Chlamydiota bacterium]
MKFNEVLLCIFFLLFCAFAADGAQLFVTLNVDGNYITNVPDPVADSHAVNKRYADQVFAENALNALPAKCAGGQIAGYTPVPGEDLHAGMQHGVDWSTNTRFTVDSTGSNVYDNLTCLMWTKNANLHQGYWTNAIDFCTNLVYGGYSDWRLPNIRELKSLVDLSKYSPALPDGHPFSFVQSYSYYYWSSSTSSYNSEYAWLVNIGHGHVSISAKAYGFSRCVWPVRSGL